MGAVLWAVAMLGGLSLVSGPPAEAQASSQAVTDSSLAVADRPLASRAELESRLASLEEQVSGEPDRSSGDLQQRMERIRERLRTGDFRVGDLVELTVRSDEELTGKFPVNRERELELPTLPPVPLDGVLYSEVEPALQEALSEYIRNPNVRARALWRVAVVGGVASPGYYDLQPATTLSEALMRAGGPSQQAKLEDIEFRRDGKNILGRRDPERPVETLTLADLGAQRGDQLYVPAPGQGTSPMRVVGAISGVAGLAWTLTRIF